MQVKIIVGEWELREKGSRKEVKVEGIKGITNNEKKNQNKKNKNKMASGKKNTIREKECNLCAHVSELEAIKIELTLKTKKKKKEKK